ncbi:MAG: hypothetical protein MK108_06445 [Mariniblastus sp.]|nr:hypothetical protein [Mariniblastus sp.]
MSKRFRFGVDLLIPFLLVLLTLLPWILLQPDTAFGVGWFSLPGALLGWSFYWAYRDRDRKRKRLRIVFLRLVPIAILVWTISPCLMVPLSEVLVDVFGDNYEKEEEGEVLGMGWVFFLVTIPTGVVALLVWGVGWLVWLVHKNKLNRTSSP